MDVFLIPIVLGLGVVVMVIFLRKYQNDERLAMIEKGMNPGDVKMGESSNHRSMSTKIPLLLIGGGIGLLIGYFLDEYYYMEEVAYFSMLFIFGGLGLFLSYILDKRNQEESKK